MMNSTSLGSFALGFHLHIISCTLLLIAVVLFITWMIRYAKKDQLKNWIIGLVVVGLLGWILTVSAGVSGWGRFGGLHSGNMGFGPGFGFGMMMSPGMLDCAQDEDCHEEMEDIMNRMMGIEENEE